MTRILLKIYPHWHHLKRDELINDFHKLLKTLRLKLIGDISEVRYRTGFDYFANVKQIYFEANVEEIKEVEQPIEFPVHLL